MIKPIDMSVLPDGFLIEQCCSASKVGRWKHGTTLHFMRRDNLDLMRVDKWRPALNHWHHNGGTMTLPDGLVVEVKCANGNNVRGETKQGFDGVLVGSDFKSLWGLDWSCDENQPYLIGHNIVAVKILGVTSEYGPQLGMEVIEL